jgi:tetratricopeptide (TPR) repeat protein
MNRRLFLTRHNDAFRRFRRRYFDHHRFYASVGSGHGPESSFTIDEDEIILPSAMKQQFDTCKQLAQQGQYQQTLSKLNPLIQQYNEIHQESRVWGDAYALRAMTFMYLSDYQKALQDIQKCLQFDPTNMRVRHLRAKCYVQMGETTKALADYKDVVYTSQDNFTARLERARLNRYLWTVNQQQQNHDDHQLEHYISNCIHDYLIIIENCKDDTIKREALLELAYIYSATYQHQQAIQYYQLLLDKPELYQDTNTQLKAYEGLALNLAAMEDHLLAVDCLNKCIELLPHDNYYLKRAISYDALNEYDKAIEDTNKIKSSIPFANLIRAKAMIGKELFEEALLELDVAEKMGIPKQDQQVKLLREYCSSAAVKRK